MSILFRWLRDGHRDRGRSPPLLQHGVIQVGHLCTHNIKKKKMEKAGIDFGRLNPDPGGQK